MAEGSALGGRCGLLIVAYALFWQGWVYLFTVLALSGAANFFYDRFVLRNTPVAKTTTIYFGLIILAGFIAVAAAFGIHDFFVLFREGWNALQDFLAPKLSLWPDMYISVGELRRATRGDIDEFMGGAFFLFFAAVGMFGSLLRWKQKPDDIHFQKIIVLLIFGSTSLVLTLGAQRFALLCLIPLALFFTVGIQFIYGLCRSLIKKKSSSIEKEPFLVLAVTLIFLSSLAIPILNAREAIPSLLNRIFNETWEKVLTKIKNETPAEAIVNTWWPPGHFIKAIAQRRVTFDGATINKPQAYWMANVFLSPTEEEAIGYLRMLNDGANTATDYLQSLKMEVSAAVKILKAITPLNETAARNFLKNDLQPGEIDHLLKLTHAPPPPSYLLVYNELVEKNLVLSFVDRWNFERVEQINRSPQDLKIVPSKKSPEYVKFLWEIAGGPLRFSGTLPRLGREKNMVVFEENVQIDLKTMTCRIQSGKFGKGIPQGIVFLDGDKIVHKKFPDANLSFTVVLTEDHDRYSCLLMDDRLAQSLLIKLYYFDGKGLKHFRPFAQETDLTGRTKIQVYAVDWGKF